MQLTYAASLGSTFSQWQRFSALATYVASITRRPPVRVRIESTT